MQGGKEVAEGCGTRAQWRAGAGSALLECVLPCLVLCMFASCAILLALLALLRCCLFCLPGFSLVLLRSLHVGAAPSGLLLT